MEFLTASPTSYICEYNNHLTKVKIRKEVIEFYKKAHFSKLCGHIQLTETRMLTLKGLTWVSVEICNKVLVIKMNKLPDETMLKEVTDYKESKRKEDPLPQDHSPP